MDLKGASALVTGGAGGLGSQSPDNDGGAGGNTGTGGSGGLGFSAGIGGPPNHGSDGS